MDDRVRIIPKTELLDTLVGEVPARRLNLCSQ